MKQMRRMMKNVMVVVSKTKGFDLSSIFSSSFCPNILSQPSLNADFLFFMFSRKRRTKVVFTVFFRSGESRRGSLASFGGSDLHCPISLHKGSQGLRWPEGRLSWDTLLTQLTSPHPQNCQNPKERGLGAAGDGPGSPFSSLQ